MVVPSLLSSKGAKDGQGAIRIKWANPQNAASPLSLCVCAWAPVSLTPHSECRVSSHFAKEQETMSG